MSLIVIAQRYSSGDCVGDHQHSRGGVEIGPPWGSKPARSVIRRRAHDMNPNSRMGHCKQ